MPDWKYTGSGFYVFDIEQLFNGKIEKYKLSPTVGGMSNEISISKFSNRIAFIQNFDKIAVVPFPHLNLLNCEGMGQKHEYLIWREKNGFFTALDRRSNLLTWSLTSGKLLYSETQKEDASDVEMKNYHVYKSDQQDITYTQNFYRQADRSITLLQNNEKVSQYEEDNHQSLNHEMVLEKLNRQRMRNDRGLVNIDQNS